ncbi:GSK3B-interacting protein isoform X2 [Ochotona princeps]|uniref:GSK3B-interacting protein isoform X2 n=1 Tax=Ochotona princeps TaxID=9978 RepID=UPI00064C45A6|nr:GSK3B-interacting protein isoform X2 [Ochotona princeps]
METDCNPMELSSVPGFEDSSDLNGFEGADMKDMRLEADAVVNDVLFAVNNMFVSKSLRCADDVAYINVETKERSRYCLELTEAGLRELDIYTLCHAAACSQVHVGQRVLESRFSNSDRKQLLQKRPEPASRHLVPV